MPKYKTETIETKIRELLRLVDAGDLARVLASQEDYVQGRTDENKRGSGEDEAAQE